VDRLGRSPWRATSRQLLWVGAAIVLLTVAVLVGYRYDTTLWDWLQLLVVPAVIVGGGIWFNRQQRERELEVAERRAQDEILQAYLDQMSGMLIPTTDQPSLYKARPGDSLSSVARARTLTVLPRLDGERKARVVQFLYESGLISKGRRILDLREGDLNGANLGGFNLSDANLSDANLRGTNLFLATLWMTDLSRVDLSGANLRGAYLKYTDMREADLSYAYLRGARAWTEEQLRRARTLEGATMPNGQRFEDWLKDREGRSKDG
jgi:hypothetical protein